MNKNEPLLTCRGSFFLYAAPAGPGREYRQPETKIALQNFSRNLVDFLKKFMYNIYRRKVRLN